jgi:hypothetical protein
MISSKPLLLGTAVWLCSCTTDGPQIRPVVSQLNEGTTPFARAYQEGRTELASGHSGLAIVAFERALRIDPTSVKAMNGIGAAYDDLKRYDIAQRYYQQALRAEPHNPDTLNNIAVSLQLAHDPTASEWFQQAAQADPANPVIKANIAVAQAEGSKQAAPVQEAADTASDGPTTDDGRPVLERSGLSEFQLTVSKKPVAQGETIADAEAPELAATPVVAQVTAQTPGPARDKADTTTMPVVATVPPATSTRAIEVTALPPASASKQEAQTPAAGTQPHPAIATRDVKGDTPITATMPPVAPAGGMQVAALALVAALKHGPVTAAAAAEVPPRPGPQTRDTETETPIVPITATFHPVALPVALAGTIRTAAFASVPALKAEPPAPAAREPAASQHRGPLINVSNCVGRTRMARRFSDFFTDHGVAVRRRTNAPSFDCAQTVVMVRTGQEQQVEKLTQLLPIRIATATNDTMTEDIRLVLGKDLVAFDSTLGDQK